MEKVTYIPWRRVRFWRCLGCGECCRWFNVPLRPVEYVELLNRYGEGAFRFELGKVFLKRRIDGRCIFQTFREGLWLCSLQKLKPIACKLWPFMVLSSPKYGRGREAKYKYHEKTYYIYIDPRCRGILMGEASIHLERNILPEIIEISLGSPITQRFSTAQLTIYEEKANIKPIIYC